MSGMRKFIIKHREGIHIAAEVILYAAVIAMIIVNYLR